MNPSLWPIVIGIAVIVLVGAVGLILASGSGSEAEQRLDDLTGKRKKVDPVAEMLLRPTSADRGDFLAGLLPDGEGIARLFEQADVGIAPNHFLMIVGVLAVMGAGLMAAMGVPLILLPLGALMLGALPLVWLVMRKRKRVKQFIAQMPDALELVARALRAGHGLASGLRVVADEMPAPISLEFGRVFEEQNLGIPLEDAMRGLAERVPRMDVKFFVTAVVIQRATGGDLAEVLDKIGRIIRERFQILGQVQALTAEGRLSGAMLLAMPPGLLAILYALNPDYVSLLFTTVIGTKMLVGAGILQVLGALAIKKIITIKV